MTPLELHRKRMAARRETLANPFRRRRRANQSARYLNKRQTEMHRESFDRGGNPKWLAQ